MSSEYYSYILTKNKLNKVILDDKYVKTISESEYGASNNEKVFNLSDIAIVGNTTLYFRMNNKIITYKTLEQRKQEN